MDVKWIKVSTGLFDNRKIKQIEAMPDGDSLIVIWLKLLILAGEVNDSGAIYITKDIPYTDQLLANQFNRPISTVQLALQTFSQFGMIEIVDNVLMVSNWQKYQNIEGMERIREQNRLRVQKHRAKMKLLESPEIGNVTGNVSCNVTSNVSCNDHKIKNKNKKENKNNNISSTTLTEFDSLWGMYPRKQGKKKALEAYQRAKKQGATFEKVEQGIKDYNHFIDVNKIGFQFIKQGSTFFGQQAWLDDWTAKPPEPPGGGDDDLLDGII